jgi:hypothetical protein
MKREAILEFAGVVDRSGALHVSEEGRRLLAPMEGRVHVRVSRSRLPARLLQRFVTDEEVDQIAEMQFEPRNQVLKFLLTEGAWKPGKQRRSARPAARKVR